ncbi:MAG TPA: AMMECR1 domain-containing protein, partial [Bryobacteraceae bacterium]|nr:AMMECR1 domain-containing protein [Bryobacteraceae bacterium]
MEEAVIGADMGLATSLPAGSPTEIPEDSRQLHVPEWQLASLIRFARARLMRHFNDAAADAAAIPVLPQLSFDKVNVTIRTGGRVRASMSGRGSDLASAIASAVEKCLRDDRFGTPLTEQEIPGCVLELWIQTGAEPLGGLTPEAGSRELVLGIHGVDIRLDGNYAYYKPSVPLTSDLNSHAAVLEKLCNKAGLDGRAWLEPAAIVRRTHWLHAVEMPNGGCRILRRLRSSEQPSLDERSMVQAARNAANRLVAGQDGDGLFLYRYDPIKDRADAGPVSSVRHAGCAYALAWAGEFENVDGSGEFTWSAARALRGLLLRARVHPEDTNALYIPEAHGAQGKLGTSALTLLALQFGTLADLFAGQRHGLR